MDLCSTTVAKNPELLKHISIFKWYQCRVCLRRESLLTRRSWTSSNKWSLWKLMNPRITSFLMSFTLSSTYSSSWIPARCWKKLLWRISYKKKPVFTSNNTSDVSSLWITQMENSLTTSYWQKTGCLLCSDQLQHIKEFQSIHWAILGYSGLRLTNKRRL